VGCGDEGVRAIAEDRKEEGGGQSMTEERAQADAWWWEAFDRNEGCLRLSQPLDEMGGGSD